MQVLGETWRAFRVGPSERNQIAGTLHATPKLAEWQLGVSLREVIVGELRTGAPLPVRMAWEVDGDPPVRGPRSGLAAGDWPTAH